MERFGATIRTNKEHGAERISKAVFDDVELFAKGVPPFDDLTLMIVKLTS
jgi:serine phosphatase RsbU (regulator of sigma subunit)